MFSYDMFPACLIQQEEVLEGDLTIAGFGQQVNGFTSKVLIKASVEEITLDECKQIYVNAYSSDKNIPGLHVTPMVLLLNTC